MCYATEPTFHTMIRMKSSRISPHRTWHGVRMRRTDVSPDPDSAPRSVTLPASWEDSAAAALSALGGGKGPVDLAGAAQAWIAPIAAAAATAGIEAPLADRLHRLLLLRRGAPTEAVWHGDANDGPAFVLNLPAFLGSDGQLDSSGIAEAVETAVFALSAAAPKVREIDVGMADLAGLLAAVGVDYASEEARDIARCLAAIVRGRADAASGRLGRTVGANAAGGRRLAGAPDTCDGVRIGGSRPSGTAGGGRGGGDASPRHDGDPAAGSG